MRTGSLQARELPRLHLILKRLDHSAKERVRSVLDQGGSELALHLRAPDLTGAELFDAAGWLVTECRARGALAMVNDRLDVALAVGASGTHLKGESMEPRMARSIAGEGLLLGRSIHSEQEARSSVGLPVDYLFLGSVFPTQSHPGTRPIGVGVVKDAVASADVPVIAIGGITPVCVPSLLEVGIHGVAALSSVWESTHPAKVVSAYLEGLS